MRLHFAHANKGTAYSECSFQINFTNSVFDFCFTWQLLTIFFFSKLWFPFQLFHTNFMNFKLFFCDYDDDDDDVDDDTNELLESKFKFKKQNNERI